MRDSGGRAPGGPNQGTERTEEAQGTIPLAAHPSFVVYCVSNVSFVSFRRPNRTEEPPRRDWSAAELRASPCIPQGDAEPFENVPANCETAFEPFDMYEAKALEAVAQMESVIKARKS